ncbi:MAG: hypothetical protein E7080_04885 [Bacteroidales bacterium]|nr:hypothetical protein [Bacteroidales bacterium]
MEQNYEGKVAENGCNNGREWVDLGLSVMWATCNIGADSPECYGEYFAWDETKPKSEYTESNYSSNRRFVDVYWVEDIMRFTDVAKKEWGGNWRVPTKAECEELVNDCEWIWTSLRGVKGYKVIGKNGNSIFLPAAGWKTETRHLYEGVGARYWSSTAYENSYQYAFYLSYVGDFVYEVGMGQRYRGQTVRPVCD